MTEEEKRDLDMRAEMAEFHSRFRRQQILTITVLGIALFLLFLSVYTARKGGLHA